MEEVLARSSPHAHPIRKRMALYATPGAKRVSMVWAQSAGKTALMDSVMMALSATSPHHMVVASATQSGMKINVNAKTQNLDARSGVPFGIPNAKPTSIM
jgi:3-deoxy-D-manno-octulosonic-acid transferase